MQNVSAPGRNVPKNCMNDQNARELSFRTDISMHSGEVTRADALKKGEGYNPSISIERYSSAILAGTISVSGHLEDHVIHTDEQGHQEKAVEWLHSDDQNKRKKAADCLAKLSDTDGDGAVELSDVQGNSLVQTPNAIRFSNTTEISKMFIHHGQNKVFNHFFGDKRTLDVKDLQGICGSNFFLLSYGPNSPLKTEMDKAKKNHNTRTPAQIAEYIIAKYGSDREVLEALLRPYIDPMVCDTASYSIDGG